MAIAFIYIAIMIAVVFIAIGLYYQDHALISIASFFIMILGIYTFTNGIDSVNNYITNTLSIGFMMIGGYFAVTQGIKFMNEYL